MVNGCSLFDLLSLFFVTELLRDLGRRFSVVVPEKRKVCATCGSARRDAVGATRQQKRSALLVGRPGRRKLCDLQGNIPSERRLGQFDELFHFLWAAGLRFSQNFFLVISKKEPRKLSKITKRVLQYKKMVPRSVPKSIQTSNDL